MQPFGPKKRKGAGKAAVDGDREDVTGTDANNLLVARPNWTR